MKNAFRILTLGLIGLLAGISPAIAQNTTATLTIVAAQITPTVNISPPTLTVPVGHTVTYNITVAGPAGSTTPTGTVSLEAAQAGSTDFQIVGSYPLTNGAVTCTFTTPNALGNYIVKPLYSGDTKYAAWQ